MRKMTLRKPTKEPEPTLTEALSALSTIKKVLMSKSLINELQSINGVDKAIFDVVSKSKKQTTLSSFKV